MTPPCSTCNGTRHIWVNLGVPFYLESEVLCPGCSLYNASPVLPGRPFPLETKVPFIEKVEYHVFAPGQHSACGWFDRKEDAVHEATACNGRVDKVTYYANDREEVYDHAAQSEGDEE